MTSTAANFLHLKRVMPMAAAARFGAFRNLFGHFHHHNRRHDHDYIHGVRAASNQHLESLRHASAMTSAILRNMSSSTAMGEPSQLIDSSSDFEERHRHYSFITVLAMMSLFILITVSIVALILGFCRKNNTVFALGGSGGSAGSGSGGHDRKRSQADNHVSQFELDSLDVDMDDDDDDGDVETKSCKDDPGGVCYYHLSDDDDPDDDMYDSDDDYFETNDGKNTYDSEKNSSRRKKKKQKGKRKLQKAKLRFRDSRYYYHLQDGDEDTSDDDSNFHQHKRGGKEGDDGQAANMSLTLPKRSTTFPQLHSVLTSCIKGDSAPTQTGYQKLCNLSTASSSPTPSSSRSKQSTTTPSSNNSNYNNIVSIAAAVSTSTSGLISAVTPSTLTSCDNESIIIDSTRRTSLNRQKKTNTDSQIAGSSKYYQRRGRAGVNGNIPPHHTLKNQTISKLNTKKLTVSTVPHYSRQSGFLPSKRRRRLFKSYSLHDIPNNRTNKITKPGCPPPLAGGIKV